MLRKKKSLIDQAGRHGVRRTSTQVEPGSSRPWRRCGEPGRTPTRRRQGRAVLADAEAKAAPILADAKDKAGPAIAAATREVAIPKAKIAAGAAVARPRAGRRGKDLAAAKVAEAKGRAPEEKGAKLKKLLLFSSLAAVAGFVAVQAAAEASRRQLAVVVHRPPTRPPSAPPDPGRAAPARDTVADADGRRRPRRCNARTRRLSDAAEEPHPVTTPDDPAEVVESSLDRRSRSQEASSPAA